jgi:hypothetical protein
MITRRRYFLILALAAGPMFACQSFASQGNVDSSICAPKYVDRNQIDNGPLVIEHIAGTISDPGQVAIPGACLALFTDKTHKLVKKTQSDDKGKFSLARVPPEKYRLVVTADTLCAANVRLHVVGRAMKKHVLQIHMKGAGMDSCSYGELALIPTH